VISVLESGAYELQDIVVHWRAPTRLCVKLKAAPYGADDSSDANGLGGPVCLHFAWHRVSESTPAFNGLFFVIGQDFHAT